MRPELPRARTSLPVAAPLALLLAAVAPAAPESRAAPSASVTGAGRVEPAPTRPSGPPATIAVDEVRAGMIGHGLTVFGGTRVERFPVRVIGVLRRFLPQQDVILIESDDPRLKHSGIVAGMSGSPIFLRDAAAPAGTERLAGALAYGWSFAKDPIAGVTPIASMLADLRRPLRGRERTPVAEAANDERFRAPGGDPRRLLEASRPPEPPRPVLVPPHGGGLVPAAVPLSVSGFAPGVIEELSRWLSPFHLVPMAAGGGAPDQPRGPTGFEPGAALAVQLIRGDVNASATGTVTWVEGDKVLAFGHPMFNLGEIYLPIATAEVHTVLPSLSSSFKIASPLREAGSLVQDRQAGLVADTALRTDMIPVRVRVGGPDRPERGFTAEVVRHRFLTPLLASSVVANSAQAAASDVADATFTVRTSLDVRGFAPLELVDHAFTTDGVNPRTIVGLSGIKAIGEILFNPFSPANLESIEVRVDVDYRPDVAEIVGLSLAQDALDPGSRPSLRVALRPYNGAEYIEAVPFDVPRSLAGALVKIEVAAGNLVKPEVAPPQDLPGLMRNLRQSYPARSIVVTLTSPDEGIALRGRVVSDLPPSVFDTLRPSSSSRRGDTFKESARVVVPTQRVVVGRQDLQVKVREEPAL